MKTAIAAFLGLATANDIEYMTHLNKYGKSYLTLEEYNFRKAVFLDNKQFIEEHNSKESSYKLGENHMMDWTEDEYKKLLGYMGDAAEADNSTEAATNVNVPDKVDWKSKGYVTPVKN